MVRVSHDPVGKLCVVGWVRSPSLQDQVLASLNHYVPEHLGQARWERRKPVINQVEQLKLRCKISQLRGPKGGNRNVRRLQHARPAATSVSTNVPEDLIRSAMS